MKLYYSPGTCSLSPHIVARELGLELTLVQVDLATRRTSDGRDFLAINPKGYVPALELDDGKLLTEGTVIVQYLADLQARLAPAAGTLERYRVQEMLAYLNTELHKSYGPLFRPGVTAEVRAESIATIQRRYAPIERQLGGGPWLFGPDFTVADAYLFVVTNWASMVDVDLSAFPRLRAFQEQAARRPAVRAAA
ncbi:MAG: glutathione transferase GstA, partial [Myxococcales bacterium]